MNQDFENYFRRDRWLDRSKGFMVSLYARHPYLARVFREVMKLPTGSRVLDIGAGEGHFLETVRRMRPDLELVAADLTRSMIYEGLKETPFIAFDIDAGGGFPEPLGFDMVVSQHVLEHLTHPAALFQASSQALKAGGVLYIECPDVRWSLMPHLPLITGHRGGFNFWDDPTHRRPFSRPSLRRLGESAGFENIQTFYVRKWGHLLALPMAIVSRDDDYKVAALHPLLGLWCGLVARKPA
jgi:2-polyprenyl-3-methyl-5-hydroxy-6-metoxy-1,4-benzoquinol methylase